MNSSLPSERMRHFARQLLAFERAGQGSAESNLAPAERVCEALRRPLCTLAGTAGFRALLKRALALARTQVPALSAVGVNPDGSFEGLAKLVINQDTEADGVLISELLGLLAVLIGEGLTVRILIDVWPGSDNLNAGAIGEGEHDPRR
jgi:hypothetical protein